MNVVKPFVFHPSSTPFWKGKWMHGWMDLWWLLIFPVLHLVGICLPLWCHPNSRQGHHHRQRVGGGECRGVARMEHRSDSYRTINVLQELVDGFFGEVVFFHRNFSWVAERKWRSQQKKNDVNILGARETNQKGWKLDGISIFFETVKREKQGERGEGKKRSSKLGTPPQTPNLRPEFWTELFYESANDLREIPPTIRENHQKLARNMVNM